MTLAPTRTSPPSPAAPVVWRFMAEQLRRWASANRLFVGALLLATVLRIVVMAAYPPALEFFGDSPVYLSAADHLGHVGIWHPPGYSALLRVVSVTGSLGLLTALQHLFGLAAGVLVYRLMRRYGAGSVAGTIAALPLLLDAYQLDIEQFVLSDTWFVLLLVVTLGAAIRLRERGGDGLAITVGLLLATLTLTRTVGLAVVVTVGAFLLAGRMGSRRLIAVAVAFVIPVGTYAVAFRDTYGTFGLEGYTGRYLYGLVAPYATCANVPSSARSLCPQQPTYVRPGLNQFVWQSPGYLLLPGTPIERSDLAGTFARTVMLHQPADTAGTIAGNVGHYFEPGRVTGPRDWFVGSWQFPLPNRSPAWNVAPATVGFHGEPVSGRIHPSLAHWLRGYQNVVFTPGPALLVALLLTGWAAVARRGDRNARHTAILLSISGLALIVAPSATAGFDWRYLLPAQAVLLPGGLLAGGLVMRELRGHWSPRSGRIAAVAVALAVLVPGLPPSSVYASADLRPAVSGSVPAALDVGRHLRVHIGRPSLVGIECAETQDGYRVRTLARFPVSVSRRSGGSFLVQPANFGIAGQNPFDTVLLPDPTLSGIMRAAVLSSRFTRISGQLYLRLPAQSGRLQYVDPRGAGAAAWSFRIPTPAHGRAAGERCSPPPSELPHAPRFARIPAFTTASGQTLNYGPLGQPAATGTTYDVRWRVSTPVASPSRWHYPRPWQRTRLLSQALTSLAPGSTYCFSVRAHRPTGAPSAWSVPRCTTRFTDDSAVPTAGSWRRFINASGFYQGTYTSTTQRGASITLSGTASRIAVIAYRCRQCGVLVVTIGHHRLKRLNLSVPAALTGLRLWRSLPLLNPHRGVIRLTVLSHNRLVAIDAVAMQR